MSDDVIDLARKFLAIHDATWLKLRAGEIKPICTALLAADERVRAVAEAARADEREACARFAYLWMLDYVAGVKRAEALRAAIRARGQAKADGSGA